MCPEVKSTGIKLKILFIIIITEDSIYFFVYLFCLTYAFAEAQKHLASS